MHEQYAIRRHLHGDYIETDGIKYFTSFYVALRDARAATGRHPDSGEKVDARRHLHWLGNLGYMVLVDQIGKCFEPIDKSSIYGGGFKRALDLFAHLPNDDIIALYALRCSMAHDFSLAAYDDTRRPTHLFRLVDGTAAQLVRHPSRPWDGLFGIEHNDMTTTVNLERFADTVETMLTTLNRSNDSHKLRIRLRDGWYELLHRYAVSFRQQ